MEEALVSPDPGKRQKAKAGDRRTELCLAGWKELVNDRLVRREVTNTLASPLRDFAFLEHDENQEFVLTGADLKGFNRTTQADWINLPLYLSRNLQGYCFRKSDARLAIRKPQTRESVSLPQPTLTAGDCGR